MGVQIALRRGTVFSGKDMSRQAHRPSVVSYAKMAEPIKLWFGLWSRLGPRKHAVGGVHIGATWQVPLNRTYAVTMRPFCQITLTTCYFTEY